LLSGLKQLTNYLGSQSIMGKLGNCYCITHHKTSLCL